VTIAEGVPGPEGASDDAAVFVERTGLAMVRRGEWIVPAPSGRAELSSSVESGERPVEVVFPVEIEVSAPAPEIDLDQLAELVLRRLTRGLLAV
jgi:hypothetical protein